MKQIFFNSIFLLLFYLTIIYSYPCPPECICKPIDTKDDVFVQMSYLIDCSNISLNNDELIYQAQQTSKDDDNVDDNDNRPHYYAISIDLSNSLSLKKFTNDTIQLTNFSFKLNSLSLTNQRKNFLLGQNSFDSNLYQNLKVLNLSSCCQKIPENCNEIFRPLTQLQTMDLSGSNLYKTCLDSPDTISSNLRDLILRNNIFDTDAFSNSSRLFHGVRGITGALDLQNSHFKMNPKISGNCIFDVFEKITTLDLSYVQFNNDTDNTEIYLKHLLRCKHQSNDTRNGGQLISLYLRQLNLDSLPEWFTDDRFPHLRLLDLSKNNFHSIDINKYSQLDHISLAYNPIKLRNLTWSHDTTYKSINLRSIELNKTLDLSFYLKLLFKLTKNIDFSENEGEFPVDLTTIPVKQDFYLTPTPVYLNLSRTNIHSFQVNYDDIRRLDISFNSLTELNLNEQSKLKYLDCSNQYLKKLILSKDLLNLIELKCSNNSLTTIENFSSLQNEHIIFIDLSFNQIKSTEDLFSNLNGRYLRSINLQSNQIEIISSNTFHEKLIRLYEINLSSNKIHTIDSNAFQSPNLQILDLSKNPIKNIASNSILTASLRILYVFNNTQPSTINRAKQFKINYNLLSKYFKDVKSNSTIDETRSEKIVQTTKNAVRAYSIYWILGVSFLGLVFVGIYYSRKNRLSFRLPFRHYKKLDRQMLVENEAEMDQKEDDEIVMNLEEPPYNKYTTGVSTKV